MGYEPLPALDPVDPPDVLADVELAGDVEADKNTVYAELGKGYREEEARQRAKVTRNSDAGYYFTVVCASAEQAQELQARLTGGADFVEYVDGRVIARRLGQDLPADDWKPPQPKADARLAELIAPELDKKS